MPATHMLAEILMLQSPVDVTLPGVWEPGLKVILDAAKAYGVSALHTFTHVNCVTFEKLPMMPDINSENNIGFGIAPSTTYRGLRTTAASAYLSEIPDNLTIITQSKVIRILFEGTKAIGINLLNRTKCLTLVSPFVIACSNRNFSLDFAKKELILSAGSIDTPKLLLLSGVGPVEDLKRYNIPLVADLPGVGSNLRDHYIVRLRTSIKPGSLLPLDINVMRGAREQWIKDQTGPLGADNGLLALGYFKLDMSTLPEFELLDQQMQDLLLHPSVPTYELGAVSSFRHGILI
jgi:choline dehydrogenase-like flavoprotein